MRFTLQNAEKPLQCMELQEKRTKGLKHTGNPFKFKFKFVDQIQVQKPIPVAATDQMPDQTYSRQQYYQHR